jgi:hypothetical protein
MIFISIKQKMLTVFPVSIFQLHKRKIISNDLGSIRYRRDDQTSDPGSIQHPLVQELPSVQGGKHNVRFVVPILPQPKRDDVMAAYRP